MTNSRWYSDRSTGNAYKLINGTLFACPVTSNNRIETESACEVEVELQDDKNYIKEMMLLLSSIDGMGGHWESDMFIFKR
jgi:hypothetical protein